MSALGTWFGLEGSGEADTAWWVGPAAAGPWRVVGTGSCAIRRLTACHRSSFVSYLSRKAVLLWKLAITAINHLHELRN